MPFYQNLFVAESFLRSFTQILKKGNRGKAKLYKEGGPERDE